MKDINDNANNTNINEITAVGGFKEKVGIWSIQVKVIAGIGLAADTGLNISLTISADFLPICKVGIGIMEFVKCKIREVLTWIGAGRIKDTNNKANNAGADEIAVT